MEGDLAIRTVAGLNIFLGIDLLVNPVNDQTYSEPGIEVDFKRSTYLNIPILFGANFTVEFIPGTKLMIIAGLGINFYIPPNAQIRIIDSEFSLDNESTFAFKFGAAVVIDKIVLEFLLMNLGEPEITLLPKYETSSSKTLGKTQAMTLINLSIGFKF